MDHACRALVVAVDQAVPGWVLRCVRRFRLDLDHEATVAGAVARNEVIGRLEALFSLDVAEQRQNPLAVLRQAVIHPTAVLRAAAVPPVLRDDFERANFPDDVYGLSPSTWTDIDPALHEPGIMWGATKAATLLHRRRLRDSSRDTSGPE